MMYAMVNVALGNLTQNSDKQKFDLLDHTHVALIHKPLCVMTLNRGIVNVAK